MSQIFLIPEFDQAPCPFKWNHSNTHSECCNQKFMSEIIYYMSHVNMSYDNVQSLDITRYVN